MGYSTVYDVKVRYSVDNRAGGAVGGLVRDTRTLGREVGRTSSAFRMLGGTVASYFGARMAGKALIGFNAQVQDTKNQIAGMLALSKKTDLSAEMANSERIFANLQKRAATLPGTTKEYVQMAGALTQPIIDAGLTMKDLEDITVNAVVGAKALGYEWGLAARDIDQALRGQFHATDPFAGKLLGSLGYKGEEGRARFNAMSADKRAEEVKRALTQKQLTQLANAQGQTFSGALSTLQDTIEQFVGKVGLPLFQAITKELKSWNTWIDKNKSRMDDIASSIGHGLVSGFLALKDALTVIASHADTLIALGKVWAAVKVGSMLGGGMGGGGSSMASRASALFGAGGWFRGAKDGFDADGNYTHTPAGAGRSKIGLRGAADNLGLLGGALGAGYSLGNLLGLDQLGESLGGSFAMLTGRTNETARAMEALQRSQAAYDRTVRENIERHRGPRIVGARLGIRQNMEEQAALALEVAKKKAAYEEGGGFGRLNDYQGALAELNKLGVTMQDIGQAGGFTAFASGLQAKATAFSGNTAAGGALGFVAFNAALTQLTDYQRKTLDEAQAQQELLGYIHQTLAKGGAIDPRNVLEIMRAATSDPSGKHKTTAEKPRVNVTVQRIEVQSDDPDRFAFGLVEAFADAAKNPSSAFAALREG